MDIVGLGTPLGLAFASGLNAYLPMLAFALSVRWWHLYAVNPHFTFVTQNWFIAILIILTLLDFVADKIPLIDHAWDAIHTIVRPIAGAIIALAASPHVLSAMHIAMASHQAGTTTVALGVIPSLTGIVPLVLLIVGGALAALSHTTKASTRFISTLTTAGFLNGGLSLVEDALVVIIILLSLFASAIMLLLLVLLIAFLVPRLVRLR